MTDKIEPSRPTWLTRPALLEGSRGGKLPVPVGKWVWPGTALALAVATVWGATHIEEQVSRAAPEILAKAGIDSSGLDFDSSYRNVDVSGELPANASGRHVEMVLAKYAGPNGENIRKANVSAKTPVTVLPKPAARPQPEKKPQTADVRVSAVSDGNTITLTGTVPSQEDQAMLLDAAKQSFQPDSINNRLTVSDMPVKNTDTEKSLNNLATIVSNLDDGIVNAHIDLDNDLLSGNITASDSIATAKVQTFLPTSLVSVITDNLPATDSTPVEEPLIHIPPPAIVASPDEPIFTEDQVNSLQSVIDQLESEIRAQVVFAPSSDKLETSATNVLDEIVTALNTYPDTSLEIGGHTDSQSSASYNLALSQQRAEAVVNYMVFRGINRNRLVPVGFGESNPVASNDTADGRAQNRRVEFHVY